MKSKKAFAFVLLTAVLMLAGCGESMPQVTTTLIPETYTPNPSYTFFPTITPTSLTPRPTYTPRSTITPTPTMNSTQIARSTSEDFFDTKCNGLYFTVEYMSPDLGWAVCRDFQKLRLVSTSGPQWDISIVEKYSIESFTEEISPIYWTHDGQYVYVRCYGLVDGGFTFGSTIAVWRINLYDGTLSELIKPEADKNGLHGKPYAVSIAPTGRRFVYIPQYETPLQLTILDLNTGESTSIGLRHDFLWAGLFHWSPDGTKLVFELASPPANMDFTLPAYFALMYIDFESSSSAVFADHLQEDLQIIDVADNYAIYKDSDKNEWQLDFHTKYLSLIGTVTPTPTP